MLNISPVTCCLTSATYFSCYVSLLPEPSRVRLLTYFFIMDPTRNYRGTVPSTLLRPSKWLPLYEDFVTKNASSVGQVESALRSLTYIIPGSLQSNLIINIRMIKTNACVRRRTIQRFRDLVRMRYIYSQHRTQARCLTLFIQYILLYSSFRCIMIPLFLESSLDFHRTSLDPRPLPIHAIQSTGRPTPRFTVRSPSLFKWFSTQNYFGK